MHKITCCISSMLMVIHVQNYKYSMMLFKAIRTSRVHLWTRLDPKVSGVGIWQCANSAKQGTQTPVLSELKDFGHCFFSSFSHWVAALRSGGIGTRDRCSCWIDLEVQKTQQNGLKWPWCVFCWVNFPLIIWHILQKLCFFVAKSHGFDVRNGRWIR